MYTHTNRQTDELKVNSKFKSRSRQTEGTASLNSITLTHTSSNTVKLLSGIVGIHWHSTFILYIYIYCNSGCSIHT